MHDDDGVTRSTLEAELVAVTEETVRLQRDLEMIESDLARIIERFLQATGRTDLALDFLGHLGHQRHTLH